MSRESEFLIYCIEVYKESKSLTGRQVIELFKQHRVAEYLTTYFEALHTTGMKYIVADIDLYMAAAK